VSTHDAEAGARCAQCARCDGPLPDPIEVLSVVRASDGVMMLTCSTACLAELVAILAGRTRQPAAGRRN
jgi:hypothetical protein